MQRIYLDHAATTALSPEVLSQMMPYLTDVWGNASSVHTLGREARRAVDAARAEIARALGALPQEIYFTSGGTESDNWALKGAFFARGGQKGHVITTAFEHHAVLHTCAFLEKQGCEVTYLMPDADGFVSPRQVEEAITDRTFLISVMTANNEIGTVQDTAGIGAVARAYGILFHTDAVQAAGALPLDVNTLKCDMLSLSAHKFYGPKGMGVLYVRKGVRVQPLMHGGAQERGQRSGTENVAGIVGTAAALSIAQRDMRENNAHVSALRDRLLAGMREKIPGVAVNGSMANRLPGNLNVNLEGISSESLLLRLDLMGVMASGGSACTAGSIEPSHVLRSLGLPDAACRSALRFSVGKDNTEEEIDAVLALLPDVVRSLREMTAGR